MAPIVLRIKGPEGITRLAYLDSEEELSKTWKVCTKVKDSLVNGVRLENLSWRLWHLHKLMLNEQKNPTGRRRLDVKRVSQLTARRLELDVDSELAQAVSAGEVDGENIIHQNSIFSNVADEKEHEKSRLTGNDSTVSNDRQKTSDCGKDCQQQQPLPTIKAEIAFESEAIAAQQSSSDNYNTDSSAGCNLKSYAISTDVPILPGFENGIFLDDLFGGFSATAFLGNLEDGPRLEIPIDEFLDLTSLPSIESTSTAAAIADIPSHYDVLAVPLNNPNSFTTNHHHHHHHHHFSHNNNPFLHGSGGSPPMDYFDDSALLHMQSLPRLKHVEQLPAENGLGIAAAEISRPLPMHALAADVFLTSSASININGASKNPVISSVTATSSALLPSSSTNPISSSSSSSSAVQTASASKSAIALDPLMIYQYQPALIQQEPNARVIAAAKKHRNSSSVVGNGSASPTLSAASIDSSSSPAANSRKRPAIDNFCNQQCINCGVRSSPLWRRNEQDEVLCNACGLYLKMHKRSRPQTLKEIASRRAAEVEPVLNVCFNCQTVNTPLWRKGDDGTVLCNACGLYRKIHKQHRPLDQGSRKRKRPLPLENLVPTASGTLSASNYSKLLLSIQQQQQQQQQKY